MRYTFGAFETAPVPFIRESCSFRFEFSFYTRANGFHFYSRTPQGLLVTMVAVKLVANEAGAGVLPALPVSLALGVGLLYANTYLLSPFGDRLVVAMLKL